MNWHIEEINKRNRRRIKAGLLLVVVAFLFWLLLQLSGMGYTSPGVPAAR
jgi:hypothetical protein